MTVQDAYEIVMKENPQMTVVECLEFSVFYAFALAEKGKEQETMIGGYETVNKVNGSIGGFTPTQDFKAFFSAKKIDISELD